MKKLEDLRYVNQIKKEKLAWLSYKLPPYLALSLIELMKKMSLTLASPEFLLLDDGRHIFIDLNTVGDWFGFFSNDVNEEIISNLVDFLKTKLNIQKAL